jgi:hypothetical protein
VKLRKIIAFGVTLLTGLALSGATLAALPDPYRGEGGEAQQGVGGVGADTLGNLPFTGLDLALIVGAGLLLVIAGVSIRRVASRRS